MPASLNTARTLLVAGLVLQIGFGSSAGAQFINSGGSRPSFTPVAVPRSLPTFTVPVQTSKPVQPAPVQLPITPVATPVSNVPTHTIAPVTTGITLTSPMQLPPAVLPTLPVQLPTSTFQPTLPVQGPVTTVIPTLPIQPNIMTPVAPNIKTSVQPPMTSILPPTATPTTLPGADRTPSIQTPVTPDITIFPAPKGNETGGTTTNNGQPPMTSVVIPVNPPEQPNTGTTTAPPKDPPANPPVTDNKPVDPSGPPVAEVPGTPPKSPPGTDDGTPLPPPPPDKPETAGEPSTPDTGTAPPPLSNDPQPPANTANAPTVPPAVATDSTRVTPAIDMGVPTFEPTHPGTFQFIKSSCSGIADKTNNSVAFPVRGALYRQERGSGIELARGRMLVIADDKTVKLSTRKAQVSIPPSTAAIVDVGTGGATTILSLSGKSGAVVSFKDGADNAVTAVDLPAGRSVVIACESLGNEELIPADGIAWQPVEGMIQKYHTARLYEFSLHKVLAHNMLLPCKQLQIHPSSKAAELFRKTQQDMLAEGMRQPPFASTSVISEIVRDRALHGNSPDGAAMATQTATIALATSAGVASPDRYRTVVSNNDTVVVSGGECRCDLTAPNTITLKFGTLLVKSRTPLQVKAGDYGICVQSNAIALIRLEGVDCKVINLSDLKSQSVRVISRQRVLDLKTAQELVVSPNAPALFHVFDVHTVAHRGIRTRTVDDFGWVTTSEVYLPDLLAGHPLVTALRKSGRRSEKKLMDQITLTAAVLNMTRRSSEPFERGMPEDETFAAPAVIAECTGCLQNK